MNLFTKIDSYIDYNNHYSIRKALETLRQEFEKASRFKNIGYASEVVYALKKVYDKLHKTYRQSEDLGETMSYSQRRMSAMMQELISIFTGRLRKEFGAVPTELEELINVDQ